MCARSLIVARSLNNVIGNAGRIPWALPADLRRFKRLTMGRPIIMGRKTFQSLPGLLPGRMHVVLSNSPKGTWTDLRLPNQVRVFTDIHEAVLWAEDFDKHSDRPEVFLIGGATLYKQALENDLVDTAYVTEINLLAQGDCFFHYSFDPPNWTRVDVEEITDQESETSYVNMTYCRRR